MPKQKKQTSRAHIRIEPELLEQAQAKAKQQGLTLSKVIRALLLWWIKSDKLPE